MKMEKNSGVQEAKLTGRGKQGLIAKSFSTLLLALGLLGISLTFTGCLVVDDQGHHHPWWWHHHEGPPPPP